MPDARKLRLITDALRALADRAQAAGSPTGRALIQQTAAALKGIAEQAEREQPTRGSRPSDPSSPT